MSKIFCVAGDCHGNVHAMYYHLGCLEQRLDIKIAAVLHVGDFGLYHDHRRADSDWSAYWRGRFKIPIPTWVNLGNHEGWEEVVEWMGQPDKIPNLHLLPDGEVTDVLGLKVGAIWGNYSPKSYADPRIVAQVRNFAPNSVKAMHIYQPSVEKLKVAGEFDILISHDSPYGVMQGRQPTASIKKQLGIDKDEITTGCSGLNEIWETSQAKYHVWGHHHRLFHAPAHLSPILHCCHTFSYDPANSIYLIEVPDE